MFKFFRAEPFTFDHKPLQSSISRLLRIVVGTRAPITFAVGNEKEKLHLVQMSIKQARDTTPCEDHFLIILRGVMTGG